MAYIGGPETRVNSYIVGAQGRYQVVTLDGGGWVVAWVSENQDGSGLGVYQQAFDANGSAVGGEVRVNTDTQDSQHELALTARASGGWVVTWTSFGQDGSGNGVYQQVYDASGSAVGNETRVNSTVTGHQANPQVAELAGGGWVVTWTGQDLHGTGIFQQVYDENGVASGGEVQVDTGVTDGQVGSQVTALTNGGWVVTWASGVSTGWNVHQQAYDANGEPVGNEVRINTHTQQFQGVHQTKPLPGGGWVVVWASEDPGSSAADIFQQVFDANGAAVGGETRVNTIWLSDQLAPDITVLSNGGWVVTWTSFVQQDGSGEVYQRAYRADGSAIGAETLVNTHIRGDHSPPKVTALADGGWVVVWTSSGQDIYLQAYDANGVAAGGETRVNTHVDSAQNAPSVKALPDGWVVTWTSYAQDGDGYGVYQRVFDVGVNNAPSGADKTIAINEDGSRMFAASDFGVSDADGNNLAAVIVTTLPNQGSLTLNGSAVTAGQSIVADNLGGLEWTPPANANGAGLSSFTFQVVDSGGTADGGQNTDQSPNTITFDVASIDDAPEARDDEASVVEYAIVSGNVLTGPGQDTDVDGDQLEVFNVAGASGSVQAGVAVAGRYGTLTIQADGTYSYVASNAEALAAGQSGFDVFTYSLSDGRGVDSATLTITVNGTNGGTAADDLLRGTNAAESFLAGAGDDIVDARGGNDTLDGGSGFDVLIGGAGNDTYALGAENDTVSDSAGVDTITSTISRSLASYVGIENLTLLGAAAIGGTGNAANNLITGNGANNVLNGGGGADTLVGGAGNDTYVTDGGDTIVEAANGGTDTVQSSVDYALGSNLENLTLTGNANVGTGNSLANVITGNNLANALNGGAGADRLVGGLGNDSYYVDDARDVIVESANQGTDRVISSVSHVLAANVENLTLIGSAVSGIGNALNNVITGTAGKNTLAGGLGNDTLTGGAGTDTFLFNTALSRTANVDRITDFNVAQDTIQLENAVFKGLANGWLDANAFHTGAAAADAQDRIIYNKANGALLFDADGSGKGAAVHFATVSAGLSLTSADFHVI